ncbi:hypothetical protein SADUNF_Sadunf11G0092300 [Salix dunnii]|uniref:non-specific serine/threonine protein kinase n=1 Tax=Salix dunnii TaxID=1413687 RepID=A0A835JMB7_9ROSI|nr:hypothetical protein SADUNF_Sadunf11G0092300 [Salix dunnii]
MINTNRETPISDRLGVLNITREGTLILYNRSSYIVRLSNSSRTAENPVAELLESGNLVIREENDSNPENFLWQSFDHPCDTLILGMKLGSNFVTKMDRFLSSWRSAEDPSRGQYSFVIDTHGYPQLLLKSGNKTLYRAGSWNGIKFVSDPRRKSISNEFVVNSKEVYYQFGIQSSVRSRLTLSPSGAPRTYTWNDRTNDWVITDVGQFDQCENYAFCGPNTRCEMSRSPTCACLDGFVPKSLADWNFSDWRGGCIRRNPLQCSDKVGFLKYTGMKLPDTSSSWYNKSISLKECERLCLKNCSCTAYANLDVRNGGSGCLIWFGELIDTRRSTGDGQDLYVRMNATELDMLTRKRTFSKKKLAGIVSSAIVSGIGMLILGFIFSKRKRNLRKKKHWERRQEHMELPVFNMSTITHATDTFSENNKLGEGGFGPVYKGILTGGQQIAVKRLSKSSGQGLDEFKNEVMLIAKLQHRNLVKLVGYCIHEDERMLIYEYMPNKSLDSFIFGANPSKIIRLKFYKFSFIYALSVTNLAWMLWIKGTPFELIDECLAESCNSSDIIRCIHVALLCVQQRPEDRPNMSDVVLILGSDMPLPQPKQPGFFTGENPHEQSTSSNKHVTYSGAEVSLMSLEARSLQWEDMELPWYDLSTIGHATNNFSSSNKLGEGGFRPVYKAWILWTKGAQLDLIDECLSDLHISVEVLRCIHVALLCVQQRPEDKPTMSSVVVMLGSENQLPQPKQPGFFMGKNPPDQGSSSSKHESYSANKVTLTSLEARKGILVLYSSTNDIVWSSNSSRTAENPVAELLESGNLVVREQNDSNPENFLWQSFDHPCDTLILGMKLGSNFVTKIEKFLSSWRSAENPARGEYSFLIDTHGYPQLLMKRGNITLFRAGPWNGIKFVSNPRPVTVSTDFVFNSKEVYYQFAIQSSRLTISPSGLPQSYTWNDRTNDWAITAGGQYDQCENYAFCGPNTRCEINRSPLCACLDGFMPKSPADWNISDWSGGCIRRTPLECSDKVGFKKYTGMKLPDTSSSWYDMSISLKECEGLCLKNCSCTAYANLDIRNGGSGCLIWFGDLIDTRKSNGDGQDLYVRMNAIELDMLTRKRTLSNKKLAGIVSSAIVSGIGMLISGFIFSMRKRNLRKKKHWERRQEDMELPVFDMSTLAHATDTFSENNKLGEGGFGPVYKGILTGGQQIAVKRLSKSSGQGLDEFKNEVMLIAKLQHRNLVKLLGCCIHEDERMLIYEYMPNKSLDSFIFGANPSKIIRLKKFIEALMSENSSRIAKSAEIFSWFLFLKAWMLWIKGTQSELIDECLAESSNSSDIIRCIHVALLCVQQRPEDRPNMSAVVVILGSDMPLPQPKQPGFFMGENPYEQSTSSNKHEPYSGDEVSMMSLEPRFFVILVCCFLLFTLTNSSTPAIINPSQSIRDGVLVLYSSTNDIVWSSISSRTSENPVAELLESGNLVVREGNDSNPTNFLWQSFDHPCDTMILGMKLGINFVTKMDKFLSSWRSAEDPARGEYSLVIDTHGYPQLLLKRGNITLVRPGSWNGIKFVSNPRSLPISNEFVFNSKEVYYRFGIQSSVRSRLTLSPLGFPQSYTWNDRTNDWVITDVGQSDQCGKYAFCGPNTHCEMSISPICVCLDGFVPKSPADWNFSDWSGGCIRRYPLKCSDIVGFLLYTGMKLPDTSSSWYNKSISLKECEGMCLKNCSCTAYANLDVRNGGSGCLIWFGDLIDTRRSTGDGQDLYVKMKATELGMLTRKRTFSKKKLAGIASSAIVSGIGMLMLGFIFSMRKKNLRKKKHREARQEHMELPVFDMSTIAHATDTFSDSNKLGEGGFGPVYKGIIKGGQQIAVKRLSKSSGQGLDEFKNEVMLIAKLQHRNLVKLLGCCIHEDERMLIYEYMPNKSLDSFIFGANPSKIIRLKFSFIYAWMLWIKGTPLELIDECLAEWSNSSDIIRCIHVALLCVQQRPEDRPNMSAVVLILGSDMPLPQPKQPGFFMGENPQEQRTSSNNHETYSGAEVSLMSLEARPIIVFHEENCSWWFLIIFLRGLFDIFIFSVL